MIGRTVLIALPALLGVALVLATRGDAAESPVSCGTKTLYGRTLTLHAEGVSCADVARITRGECQVDGRPWWCFAPLPPGPQLIWMKDSERFAEKPSAWIEARRLPCAQSRVTAAGWRKARGQTGRRFPREEQVLADDLLRCKQLKGKRRAAVRAFLGKPDETDPRAMYWSIGEQRDSMFQIDSEFLTVSFTRDGVVRSVSIEQG